jgi:hypothetical protein
MNVITKRTSFRPALLLLCVASLVVAMVRPATAHEVEFRPRVSHHFYYQHGRAFRFPHWLRDERDFQRWFLHSDYRYIRGANWAALYDLYLFEKRHRRRAHQRVLGKVYVDLDRPRHRRHK